MPVSTNAHHTQLPATPLRRTMSVTRFGVSLLNVVATIDSPPSHHGTERPEAKNSVVLSPARRPTNRAGRKQRASASPAISQSIGWRCTGRDCTPTATRPEWPARMPDPGRRAFGGRSAASAGRRGVLGPALCPLADGGERGLERAALG